MHTVRANFEFLEKLGVDKWCFHDRDIAPEGNTLKVSKLFGTMQIARCRYSPNVNV